MKALMSHVPGTPDTLAIEEVAEPVPGPGQARVRVAACAVNFPDVLMIQDRYQIRPPRPFAPGAEIAGVVDAVGAGVVRVRPGDRVMAVCNWGGMAEKLLVAEDVCHVVPADIPLDDAATLQITYGTSLYALAHCGRLEAGQRLLVLGAAGGVGLAAVELGKALGADVIAAVSSEEKAMLARAAGADTTVIYPRGPFDDNGRRALSALFKDAGSADVILDPVGGDYAEAAFRSIAWGGRFVVVGFAAGIPRMPLNVILLKGASVVSAPWGAVVAQDPEASRAIIDKLLSLHQAGLIRPRISQRLPLVQAAKGIADLMARNAQGKIVIQPNPKD